MKVVALLLALNAGFPLLELEVNKNQLKGQWLKYVILIPNKTLAFS